MFDTVLQVYAYYSNEIHQEIQTKGLSVLNFSFLRKYRLIRKAIINLISTFVSGTDNIAEIYNEYFPKIFTLLESHSISNMEVREPEILKLFAICIEKFNSKIEPAVPKILELAFSSTLDMIVKDLNSYPDHRINFFVLLKSVVINSLNCLYQYLFSIICNSG